MDAAGDREETVRASLCVLASGSGGNCSALLVERGGARSIALIDAGLSPRRARRLLEGLGASLDEVEDALFTHLDQDHCRETWASALPARALVRVHAAHRARAARLGLTRRRVAPFEDELELRCGVRVRAVRVAHDSLGVAAFRFELGGASLGFATDVGRVSVELEDGLRGVDVLAIESNYCPKLQVASARPEFLKRRIMGGAGHLSNAECAEAARRIGVRDRVVLLHLSEECNEPARAAAAHAGAPYALTISSQREPTGWIPIGMARREPAVRVRAAAGAMQRTLFG